MTTANPSINYGSFIMMKCARVKKNFDDKAIALPTSVIQLMNADFDGDQINVFRIYGLDLGKRFARNLSPERNLYISRMTGKVETKMLPIKDETAAFWALNNI